MNSVRPAPEVGGFLYGISADSTDDGQVVMRVVAFPVTRRTRWRIYYTRVEPTGETAADISHVDRQTLERDGEAYSQGAGWWDPHHHVYAEPPVLESADTPVSGRELTAPATRGR